MGLPYPRTLPPVNITQTTCELNGFLLFDGDLPCTLWFEWRVLRVFDFSHKKTEETYNHSSGDSKTQLILHLGYPNKYQHRLVAQNADGINAGEWADWWGMRGRADAPGAPFFVQSYSYHWCDDWKIFWCKTDIGCHLTAHILHGWSPMIRGFHKKGGAFFRHDPGHTYKTKGLVEQMEIGDTIEHTFYIYFPLEPGRRYWYLTGTVDGELSPSATPLFYEYRKSWTVKQICDEFAEFTNIDSSGYQIAMSFQALDTYVLEGIKMRLWFDFNWYDKDEWTVSIWRTTIQGKPINIPLTEVAFHINSTDNQGWKTYWWRISPISMQKYDRYALVFTRQMPRPRFYYPVWGAEVSETSFPCRIGRYMWWRPKPDYNWIGPFLNAHYRFGLCTLPEENPTGHEILFPPQPGDWWE